MFKRSEPRAPAVHVCFFEIEGLFLCPQFRSRLDACLWALEQIREIKPTLYYQTLGKLTERGSFTREDHVLLIGEQLSHHERLVVYELQTAKAAREMLKSAFVCEAF